MQSFKQPNFAPLWANGPVPGELFDLQPTAANNYQPGNDARQQTATPITTGTSVVGIKFDQGVMIAADNLVSYGSLARYQDVQRVFKINEKTILAAGGDFADFQSLKRTIDQKIIDDMCYDDKIVMQPLAMYTWLTRVMYNRRTRINPLWLELVVGGMQGDVPFLGSVDLRGRAYEDDVIATGFGKHLALPLVREQLIPGQLLTQTQASDVLRKCMEVLYYRDCRSLPKYSVAVCTKQGSIVQGPFNVSENWQVAEMVKGF